MVTENPSQIVETTKYQIANTQKYPQIPNTKTINCKQMQKEAIKIESSTRYVLRPVCDTCTPPPHTHTTHTHGTPTRTHTETPVLGFYACTYANDVAERRASGVGREATSYWITRHLHISAPTPQALGSSEQAPICTAAAAQLPPRSAWLARRQV